MTAELVGTLGGRKELAIARATWTRLRNRGAFRGAILEGRRVVAFLWDEPGCSVTVFGDSLDGSVETTKADLARFLLSAELFPEGEFFAVAADGSFTIHADRAMYACDVSVWLSSEAE